jgi:hypothetical protein
MKAKEFIKKHTPYAELPDTYEVKTEELCKLMDEYAKAVIIELNKWLNESDYYEVMDGLWCNGILNYKGEFEYFTTSQLFDKYLEETK